MTTMIEPRAWRASGAIAPAATQISISAGLSAPGDARTMHLAVRLMYSHQDTHTHTEAAIYWSAVSLIVCEGLSIGAAAERLGIESARLRNILRRRRHRLAERLRLSGVKNATPAADGRH